MYFYDFNMTIFSIFYKCKTFAVGFRGRVGGPGPHFVIKLLKKMGRTTENVNH